MADYVTQGTVQFEINGADLVIRINPSQNYVVKHNDKNYIILMPINVSTIKAKVFEVPAEAKLSTKKDILLKTTLIYAALNNTNIEIIVEIDGGSIKGIKSIKIPATL